MMVNRQSGVGDEKVKQENTGLRGKYQRLQEPQEMMKAV
jgi:hypothetical protein